MDEEIFGIEYSGKCHHSGPAICTVICGEHNQNSIPWGMYVGMYRLWVAP